MRQSPSATRQAPRAKRSSVAASSAALLRRAVRRSTAARCTACCAPSRHALIVRSRVFPCAPSLVLHSHYKSCSVLDGFITHPALRVALHGQRRLALRPPHLRLTRCTVPLWLAHFARLRSPRCSRNPSPGRSAVVVRVWPCGTAERRRFADVLLADAPPPWCVRLRPCMAVLRRPTLGQVACCGMCCAGRRHR